MFIIQFYPMSLERFLCLSDIINLPWLNTITVCYNLKINQIRNNHLLPSPPYPLLTQIRHKYNCSSCCNFPYPGMLMSLSGVSGWDEEYRYPDNGSPSPQRRERSKAPMGKVPCLLARAQIISQRLPPTLGLTSVNMIFWSRNKKNCRLSTTFLPCSSLFSGK